MEDIPSVSSEEELLRLRDEGKITEAEYEQLRKAMEKTREGQAERAGVEQEKSKRRRGRTAFALMLVGIMGPCLLYLAVNLLAPPKPNWERSPGAELLAALALEVAAFAMGISAWPDVYAKAAVVVSGFCIVVFVLFAAQPYVF
jgi:hypothetical protein